MTANVQKVAEEGNVVGMRHKAYAPVVCARDRHIRTGDASFTRSFDPCTSILATVSAAQAAGMRGVRVGITVGQTRVTERNQHWGWHERTKRGSPHVTASARERAWHVQEKEGDRGLRPCEDQEPIMVRLPARRSAVAEVSRRQLVSNKLGKRAPKRAAGSSERGPSLERGSAGETVGKRAWRKEVAGRTHA